MYIYIRYFCPFRAKKIKHLLCCCCFYSIMTNITKFIKEIRVIAEEFIGKDFRRSRNSPSTLRDPLFTESKATTWKVLCRKSGMLVGSCYSCSVAVKCGLGEIVWGL